MYPLNLSLPAPAIGFAVANDEKEHQALSESGYLPAFAAEQAATPQDATDQTSELQSENAPDGVATKRGPGRPKKED